MTRSCTAGPRRRWSSERRTSGRCRIEGDERGAQRLVDRHSTAAIPVMRVNLSKFASRRSRRTGARVDEHDEVVHLAVGAVTVEVELPSAPDRHEVGIVFIPPVDLESVPRSRPAVRRHHSVNVLLAAGQRPADVPSAAPPPAVGRDAYRPRQHQDPCQAVARAPRTNQRCQWPSLVSPSYRSSGASWPLVRAALTSDGQAEGHG